MQQPILLVLAAGMGSRYGGLKQIDPLGPNGETIIDYSIYDAKKAGFGKIIFVIRKSIEDDFKEVVLNKYTSHIEVDYVLQELDSLPMGFVCPTERAKPWGTGHAILMAKEKINTFFAVINGDDFYGSHAFQTMADYLSSLSIQKDTDAYSMIAYSLSRTLSENGSVSRGVCTENENNFLINIKEHTKIQQMDNHVVNINPDGSLDYLNPNAPVSMNFWGFHPSLFMHLESMFKEFLKHNITDLKSEFYIPFAVDDLIKAGKVQVKLLKTKSEWFGVTYQEDRQQVATKFRQFLLDNVYPQKLW
ncbi:MAG: nucleotidyltransferase [Bacteroidales bacterium]|jgi:UTP-glucose-1-phosphate uridylyltransferase|nr:nucleotidyltransferase [Bacteroidales bacterium]